MTRWRIIAETKSDICQGKYFKVSPKIFHWHLDISPGDQYTSLILDIIPGRQCHPCTHWLPPPQQRGILCCLGLFHPRTGYLCLRISLMLRRDTIIALRTFVQSASSLTALTTSINNIKSNIIIGSYCDSRSHLYISDHQIRLHTTLCNRAFYQMLSKIQSGKAYTHFQAYVYKYVFTYLLNTKYLWQLLYPGFPMSAECWRGLYVARTGRAGRECGAWVTQLCAGSHRGETWPGHREGTHTETW